MRERKQCGFFERFRLGLEGEGAGAVPEAKQEKRRGGGRDGGSRRGVTPSFIIARTLADTVRFYVPQVTYPRAKRYGRHHTIRESCRIAKPKANFLSSFYD